MQNCDDDDDDNDDDDDDDNGGDYDDDAIFMQIPAAMCVYPGCNNTWHSGTIVQKSFRGPLNGL